MKKAFVNTCLMDTLRIFEGCDKVMIGLPKRTIGKIGSFRADDTAIRFPWGNNPSKGANATQS